MRPLIYVLLSILIHSSRENKRWKRVRPLIVETGSRSVAKHKFELFVFYSPLKKLITIIKNSRKVQTGGV